MVTALAVLALSSTALITTTELAVADAGAASTPETAIQISSLPFEGSAEPMAAPEATDPAGRVVAGACQGGAAIYGTTWWKYTASAATTFIVHAAIPFGGPANLQPVDVAVVAGDLASVSSCGKPGSNITDAGATTLSAGETVYFVTYLTDPTDFTIVTASIGVYPASGPAPTNDVSTSPTTIGSLPFTATQDTTLARKYSGGPACYNKFGVGPTVWYSYTATRTQLVDISVATDYEADFVIAPSDGFGDSSYICGGQQFQATTGVTYLIGVYAWDALHNGGQLTIKLSAAPAAPTVKITLPKAGTVNKKTGVVRFSGTVTCSGTEATDPVTGNLHQVFKRGIHDQAFTGSSAKCTGRPATWTAKVAPTSFIFRGKTKVTASVTACNTGGCTTATTTRTVKLKVS